MSTPADDPSHLIERLNAARQESLAALQGVDGSAIVHPATGWRVKDLIGHLALWEEEVCYSLRAFLGGQAYKIVDFTSDDEYNQEDYLKRLDQPAGKIFHDWARARAQMVALISLFKPAQLAEQIVCPWGAFSRLEGIVQDMIQHEREHVEEIRRALALGGHAR
jgi:hypothetical protein